MDSSALLFKVSIGDITQTEVFFVHNSHFWSVSFSGTSDIFATCCFQDIRVWHLPTNKELLRMTVPNMTCNAIEFMRDGRSIVSGKKVKVTI